MTLTVPDPPPPAPRLLPETARAVDHQLAEAQRTGQVPSLIAGVVRGGGLVHLGLAGDPPRTVGRPPGGDRAYPGLQFRIGSLTKTMTAVLTLQARDDGRLNLDDLLYRYLPGTPVGAVSLRQLLAHVSGMHHEPVGEWWERAPGADLPTLLDGITSEALIHQPWRRHHYSNLAYGLLGAALEQATGETWPDLLSKRLLEPLGLHRTTYHPLEPFARGYVVHPWHGTLREEPRRDTGAMAPAGQLWSTAADLARFAGFLADPDPAVLAPSTVAEMWSPVVMSDLDGWRTGQGLGIQLWRDRDRIYGGHGGSMPGYLAALLLHRPTGTGLVAFANAYTLRGDSLPGLARRLLTEVLDREPPAPVAWQPRPPAPPEVVPLCGRWWWMGQEYEVSWDPTTAELLVTDRSGPAAPPSRFVREGTDRWRGTDGENAGELCLVQRGRDGAPAALDIAACRLLRLP